MRHAAAEAQGRGQDIAEPARRRRQAEHRDEGQRRQLDLARVYASVIPGNKASLRVFEKLGYAVDDSPAARAYADEPDDLVLVVDRAGFEQAYAEALAAIQITVR